MYDVYLGNMLLPVTPGKITTKIEGKNNTITLIDGHDINIIKTPGLTEITFTALLPNTPYPFARYKSGFQGAVYYLDELERLKRDEKKKGFQFIVSRQISAGKPLYSTNLKMALEDYSIEESEGFDVNVSVTLKQCPEYGTKILSVVSQSESGIVAKVEKLY